MEKSKFDEGKSAIGEMTRRPSGPCWAMMIRESKTTMGSLIDAQTHSKSEVKKYPLGFGFDYYFFSSEMLPLKSPYYRQTFAGSPTSTVKLRLSAPINPPTPSVQNGLHHNIHVKSSQ
jgi:hypothetical protein